MPSKVSKLPSPPHVPEFLTVDQPEFIPSTSELDMRLEVLEKIKLKHMERKKHADENLRASEEEIRKIKEREKGKSKAVEKIKHERDCT
jgi:transcriptional adapter 3